ncbi:acyl-CoA dehydratase activase [bacterium]|nr:acyl-CoA dehydratase activase [bacterium]
MITVGIDAGAKNIKITFLKDGEVIATGISPSGFDQNAASEALMNETLAKVGLTHSDVDVICSTGAGRKVVPGAKHVLTEVSAMARGSLFLRPDVRTVIDVGAEEGRAIRCNEAGKVEDFAVNEKCAAGSGAFTEAMARALEVSLEELGKLSLTSSASVPMNAQCAVFAESEVISLLHASTPKQDIAKAIHDAIASRIMSMCRRVGINPAIMLVGGVARNVGFVQSLRTAMEEEVFVPDNPEFVGSLGAALIAADREVETATA